MKIELFKFLSENEINEIYEIIFEIKSKVKSKKITNSDAYLEIKYGEKIKNWLNSIERIDEFYDAFLPVLHKKLLDGYKKIFEPLIEKGVLIASNAGTQLGVIRDENLIRWDDDIDLIMDIKDFNRWKKRLKWNAMKCGWHMWVRDWIKDDFTNYKYKNYVWVQFFSLKRLKLDFGKFETSFFPFIDLFPGIKVSEKLKQSDKEKITLRLVEYYDKYNCNVSKRLTKNGRYKNETINYFEGLSNLSKGFNEHDNIKQVLSKTLDEYYDENGNYIFQLNVASPLFATFDYTNRNIKNIDVDSVNYKFIVTDNFEEQFIKEYGLGWKEPKRTHVHIILPWFIKFKNTK